MKTAKDMQFNVVFLPEPEGGFTAIVPSLPGCVTYGKDLREAKKAAADAAKGYVASIKKHGGIVPTDAESFMSTIRFSPNTTRRYA